MLRDFAALFRVFDRRPVTAPSAGADRASTPARRGPTAFRALAILLCSAALCGCGIKGALRLPPPAAPTAAPVDPASPPASLESPAATPAAEKPKP